MSIDDFLTLSSLPDVSVDTEGALDHTRGQGIRRRRRRAAVSSLAAVLAVVTMTAGGLRLIGDDSDEIRTIPGNTSSTVEEEGTTSTVDSTTSTTTSTTTAPVTPVDTTACTQDAVMASLGYTADDQVSEPTCHDGWGWVDTCTPSERSEVGCYDTGKIIRQENGRWTLAGALLQDCAESFTAVGAPAEVADKFFRRCF